MINVKQSWNCQWSCPVCTTWVKWKPSYNGLNKRLLAVGSEGHCIPVSEGRIAREGRRAHILTYDVCFYISSQDVFSLSHIVWLLHIWGAMYKAFWPHKRQVLHYPNEVALRLILQKLLFQSSSNFVSSRALQSFPLDSGKAEHHFWS